MSEWNSDMSAAPDALHIRGLRVYSAETKRPLYWDAQVGYVSDEGDFLEASGDPAPWATDDYTHWAPLPEPPKSIEPERTP